MGLIYGGVEAEDLKNLTLVQDDFSGRDATEAHAGDLAAEISDRTL